MLQRAVGKNLPAKAGEARDPGSIPGSGRSPGEGNGNPLQYSCLENSMDRGAWQATVHGVAELDTTKHMCMSLIHNIINSGQDIFKRSNFFLRSISDQYFFPLKAQCLKI